eukprot:TRINITY_DN301_c4_g1_i1.p1 TRINITY_DN301_c4_g1~~TRINITY_DN301_c4_g1_i1.p1  ORF type:complete len:292 (+),score=37.55 TRINITY_DN301_c4_g1_i1:40-915(+)
MEPHVLHNAVGRYSDSLLDEEGFRRLLLGLVKRGEAGYYMRQRLVIDGESHTPLTLALQKNLENVSVALMVHTKTDCTVPSLNVETMEETTPLQWAEKSGAAARVVTWIKRGVAQAQELKKVHDLYPVPSDHDEWVEKLDFIRCGISPRATDKPAEVLPGLYLAGVDAVLEMREVTAIVNCCPSMVGTEREGIPYLAIDCDDTVGYPILKHTSEIIPFVNKHLSDESKVVIHCYGGINRSAALLLCYLMEEKQLSLTEAFTKTYRLRPIILSNKSFVSQVISFAHKLGRLA